MTEDDIKGPAVVEITGPEVAAKVKKMIEDEGYRFIPSSYPGVETLEFKGAQLQIAATILCTGGSVTFLATLPVFVDEHLRPALLEKMNEVNLSCAVGGLEIHSDTGKVWFKIGIPSKPFPTTELLVRLLLTSVHEATSFTDALLRIVAPSATSIDSDNEHKRNLKTLGAAAAKS